MCCRRRGGWSSSRTRWSTTPSRPGSGRWRSPSIRHRLAPDFDSDAARWSSKTGTLLNLRHEIGVVEHDDGSRYAVAALTESTVPAAVQPTAEAVLARLARTLHDLLHDLLRAG
ncbi:hypothetical protein CG736_08225 [Kitasatospora sp. CB02891]|nr:hypothetical protein CG736_08225 [Kitasatospora sp. CB02891]